MDAGMGRKKMHSMPYPIESSPVYTFKKIVLSFIKTIVLNL
jgi:hypothetical protein